MKQITFEIVKEKEIFRLQKVFINGKLKNLKTQKKIKKLNIQNKQNKQLKKNPYKKTRFLKEIRIR